jgi:hypothetical protein
MGVPFLLTLAVTYTAGAFVLLPFQFAFMVYDTAVFLKRAAKYTAKGVFYIQRYRANRQSIAVPEALRLEDVPDGRSWVMMNARARRETPSIPEVPADAVAKNTGKNRQPGAVVDMLDA